MRAADIDAPGVGHQEIEVFYHWWLGVDAGSLGDGDIVVHNPDGYLQRGEFVGVASVPGPFPLPLGAVAPAPDDIAQIPSPRPTLVATYRVYPPEPAPAWSASHNGRYAVTLAPGEVALDGGGFLPRKLLGGFRVAIGERVPAFPDEVRVRVGKVALENPDAPASLDDRAPDSVWATQIRLYFANPDVVVDWDELRQDGNVFTVDLEAYQLPVPPPQAWPPVVAGPPDPAAAPAAVDDGAETDPREFDAHVVARSYRLGDLDPGEYVIVVSEFGQTLARHDFQVLPDAPSDEVPPRSTLRVRNVVEATGRPLPLHVVYEDRGGVDIGTVGDGDIVVLSPCYGIDLPGVRPCPWDVQRARFVSLRADRDDLRRVVATYEIDPPPGGWSERHNGFYPVVLVGDAVCDPSGNCTPRRRLGGFEVAIDPASTPPVPAEVALRVDASSADDVVAKVHIDFKSHYQVIRQSVRRDGHRIYLLAEAEPLAVPAIFPPPPPPSQDLRYGIGALEPGDYVAAFVMNGHRYAAQEFAVDHMPPFGAEADLAVDASDPEAVTALATVRFATPHRVVGRAIEREGDHFFLRARVVPAAIDPALPPEPLPIGYRLGALRPGVYSATFEMNGFPFATQDFRVGPADEPLAAEVKLRVDASGTPVKAKAVIDFNDPFVVLTDPGTPVRDGRRIVIDATAARVDFIQAPDGAPVGAEYDLGDLPPGEYALVYKINGFFYARAGFWFVEQPVPARAEITVDASSQPVTAAVEVRFRDHYRVVERGVTRLGSRLLLWAEAEGPLPLATPVQPPPVVLDYDLGDLPPGEYTAVFVMNRHTYDTEPFRVREVPGFAVDVDLRVDPHGEEVLAQAVVDFRNPYVLVTDPGLPVRRGDQIEIRATAEEVVFIQKPDGASQEFGYNLGALRPGPYRLVYFINGVPEARTAFVVPENPDPPVARIASIDIAQGDASWFAEVGVALLPGQRVADWGEVRQDGGAFHVDITVEWSNTTPDEPQPADTDAAFQIGPDVPVRVVSQTYVLGVLDPGGYKVVVHSRGLVVARQGFVVPGLAPEIRLHVENITAPQDDAHRFTINFHDPDGLDHDSIQGAEVRVAGPGGSLLGVDLLEYASTDDVPSTGATGIYGIRPPGGSWDADDRGLYRIGIDPEAVRDLEGNALEDGRLGRFAVRILPEPPDPPGGEVRVETEMTAAGVWFAKIHLVPDDGISYRATSWGQVTPFGQTLLALATVEEIDAPAGPDLPLTHTYRLGELPPGYYLFVFKTNLAHCGMAEIIVPGEEGDGGIEGWRGLAFPGLSAAERHLLGDDADGDLLPDAGEYFFGTDPLRPDRPFVRPEIVVGEDGRRHLAVRYRRATWASGFRAVLELSRDCRIWIRPAATETELLSRTLDLAGTEERRICLVEPLDAPDAYPFARIVVERE
ncbi:hypothetical protein BH23VER1_BH23VER1_11560 [soil metagenome]